MVTLLVNVGLENVIIRLPKELDKKVETPRINSMKSRLLKPRLLKQLIQQT